MDPLESMKSADAEREEAEKIQKELGKEGARNMAGIAAEFRKTYSYETKCGYEELGSVTSQFVRGMWDFASTQYRADKGL